MANTVRDLLQETLEKEYLGKLIRKEYSPTVTFLVRQINMESGDDGLEVQFWGRSGEHRQSEHCFIDDDLPEIVQ